MEGRKFEPWNLCLFVVVAYAFSWVSWLPQVLASNKLVALPPLFVYVVGFIAPFGPLVAALALTYLREGIAGAKALLRRGAEYGFGMWWWVPTILFFPLWAGSAVLLGWIGTRAPISLPWLANPLSLVFNVNNPIYSFPYMVVFVGVAEEFGWRGYALDRIQARFNAAISSIILGFVWAFWHFPLFFIAGSQQQAATIGPYVAQILFFTFLFTWLYNNTNRSILVAILFHTLMDLTLLVVFPVTTLFGAASWPVIYMYAAGGVFLVALLVIWSPETLVRKKKPQGSGGASDIPEGNNRRMSLQAFERKLPHDHASSDGVN